MKKFVLASLLIAALASSAGAQPSGPGPVPNPWVVSGNQVSLATGRCVTLPQGVTGGCPAPNSINVSGGIYVSGNLIGVPGGSSGNVQTNNGSGGFAGISDTALTAKINLATAALPGASPAFPNNTTTFLRGDGSYAQVGNAALVNSTITVGSTSIALGATATTVAGLTLTAPVLNSPSIGFGTGSAQTITASSTNTGFANNLSVANAGTIATSGTAAAVIASLTASANVTAAMTVTGGATPIASLASGSSVTGGLAISTGAGPLTVQGLTVTASTGTLTITNAKTASFSNTITIAGTDGSTLNVSTGGTLGSLAFLSAAPAGTLTGTTLAANVVTSSLTTVGALAGGSATTGFTINAANVTWSGQIPGVSVASAANASGAPSATFGVVKCDGTTITCSSGTITAVGGVATAITVGTTTVGSGVSGNILANVSGVLQEFSISTAAQLAAGTANKIVDSAVAVSAPVPVPLSAGATVTPDLNAGYNFSLTPNQNFTLANPSNITGKTGRSFCVAITNDSTPRTITLGSSYFAPGGSANITLTASASALDQLCGFIVTTTQINVTISRAYSH